MQRILDTSVRLQVNLLARSFTPVQIYSYLCWKQHGVEFSLFGFNTAASYSFDLRSLKIQSASNRPELGPSRYSFSVECRIGGKIKDKANG